MNQSGWTNRQADSLVPGSGLMSVLSQTFREDVVAMLRRLVTESFRVCHLSPPSQRGACSRCFGRHVRIRAALLIKRSSARLLFCGEHDGEESPPSPARGCAIIDHLLRAWARRACILFSPGRPSSPDSLLPPVMCAWLSTFFPASAASFSAATEWIGVHATGTTFALALPVLIDCLDVGSSHDCVSCQLLDHLRSWELSFVCQASQPALCFMAFDSAPS